MTLAHDEGAPLGRVTAAGAGYWLVTDDEPCLFGCDPPCPTGEIVNPTIARTTFPTRCEPRRPGLNPAGVPAEVDNSLPAPAWPQSTAEARTDVSGTATGRNTELVLPAGVRYSAAGSTGIATVSRETGEYSGTARTFLSELVTPTGDLASITSLMRVTAAPTGGQPRVTYLLSLASASGGGSRTEVDEQGFTVAGVDIPAGDVVAHFNSQLAGLAKSLSALGELGLGVLAPQVGRSYDGRRYRIAAPVFSLGADPSAAKTTPARESGVRLAAAVFEGSYGMPDPVLRLTPALGRWQAGPVSETLADAVAALREMLLDPGMHRAIAAGRRHGTVPPAWRRAELRPVELKGGRHLQEVRYDERTAHTRNLTYPEAAAAGVDELLAEPFGTWLVESSEASLQVRVTKKGQARVHRGAPPATLAAPSHDRAKARLLDPDDPLFTVLGADAAKRRQVDAFLRMLAPALDAVAGSDAAAGRRPGLRQRLPELRGVRAADRLREGRPDDRGGRAPGRARAQRRPGRQARLVGAGGLRRGHDPGRGPARRRRRPRTARVRHGDGRGDRPRGRLGGAGRRRRAVLSPRDRRESARVRPARAVRRADAARDPAGALRRRPDRRAAGVRPAAGGIPGRRGGVRQYGTHVTERGDPGSPHGRVGGPRARRGVPWAGCGLGPPPGSDCHAGQGTDGPSWRCVVKRPRARWYVGALAVLVAAVVVPRAHAETDEAFRFGDDRIIESSGLAASSLHDGVVYTHNDSGGGPVVYAVGSDGKTRAALTLRGAPDRDWEAIAPGRDPEGRPALWVGDIGDNIIGWDDIRVLRVREPDKLDDADVPFTRYKFRYADGKSHDAEALLADPRTGRLYVVTKEDKDTAGVYRAPENLEADKTNVLKRVADAPAEVTDGAFTRDGSHIVLRGYLSAKVFDRDWKPVGSMSAPLQMQGESVAAASDGHAMLFGSEGLGSAVWRVSLPEKFGGEKGSDDDETAAPKKTAEKADDVEEKSTESASPDPEAEPQGLPGVDGKLVAGLGALGLGALILVLVVRRG